MKERIDIKFGRKVAFFRLQMGISQERFAEICNVHRTYIGAVERGEKSPTLKTVEKIANGLNVRISELFADL